MKPTRSSDFPDSRPRVDGISDIKAAEMRMIYENPAEYSDWRIRMGLEQKPEPRDNPVMRARIAKLFLDLGKGLEPPRSKRRPNYRPIEDLAEYARAPLTVSEEMAEFLSVER